MIIFTADAMSKLLMRATHNKRSCVVGEEIEPAFVALVEALLYRIEELEKRLEDK